VIVISLYLQVADCHILPVLAGEARLVELQLARTRVSEEVLAMLSRQTGLRRLGLVSHTSQEYWSDILQCCISKTFQALILLLCIPFSVEFLKRV
jgi:hypothetical protein